MLKKLQCFFGFIFANFKIFALLFLWLTISCVYPARRFLWNYVLVFKSGFLIFIMAAWWILLMRQKVRYCARYFCLLLALLFVSFSVTVCLSHYPVRAGSEMDILLAAIAFSFLFSCLSQKNLVLNLKIFGVFLLIAVHFAICLSLSNAPNNSFMYTFEDLFVRYFFNLSTLLQFFKLRCVNCPFEYTNYSGLMGVMALPFFVGLFTAENKRWLKVFWCLGFVESFSIAYVSNSQAARGVMWIVLCFWLFLRYVKMKKRYWGFMAIVVFITLGCCAKFPNVLEASLRFAMKDSRYHLAKSGMKLVGDKPLFGHGITTTPLHYLELQPDKVHHCWQLHVAPVQFLVEFGWIGGVLISLLILYLLYCAQMIFKAAMVPLVYKKLTLGCLMSFVAYLIFWSEASWDFFMVSSLVCFMAGVILVIYYRFCSKDKRVCKEGVIYKILITSIIFVCVFYSVRDVKGRYYFQKFDEQCRRSKFDFHWLKKALEQDRHNIFYLNQAGYFFVVKGFGFNKKVAELAIKFYEKSISINPNQLEILESLGALYVYCGQVKRGIVYFNKAICCMPKYTFAYVQLLDVLRHSKYCDVYEEWLGFLMFALPHVVLSQPDLIAYVSRSKNVQRICLSYYDDFKERYPQYFNKGMCAREKYYRQKLFQVQYPLFTWISCVKWNYPDVLGINTWMHFWLKIGDKRRGFYFENLSQHSNLNILLHAGRGVPIQIATIKDIYRLKTSRFYIEDKCLRAYLDVLVKKTENLF